MRRLLPMLLALTVSAPALAQKRPDTVWLEELTWDELRDLIRAGTTRVIIGTAGQEQKGPHMVMGEHKFVLQYTTEQIARALGNAVIAPIITYVPEGSWENPRGHMTKAGTITLPDDRFIELLTHAVRSLKASGFTDIILIGDSGGNQPGMKTVSDQLSAEWKGTGVRVHFIGDYYTKSGEDIRKYLTARLGVTEAEIGSHAGMTDTSQLLYVNATLIRKDKMIPGNGSPETGVNGDPTKATAELGKAQLDIKINNALAQIRSLLSTGGGGDR